MSKEQILIAGAGIAGLTAALSLAQYGIQSQIIEAFEAPGEVGAGIQVPPNAWRILAKLGLEDALLKSAILPQSIRLGDAHSGKIVLDMPVNQEGQSDRRFGAIHRAKLHRILWDAAMDSDDIEIELGLHVEDIVEHAGHVEVTCTSKSGNRTMSGRLLIGADGIWSNVRRFVPGATLPKATGRIALRAVVPALKGDNTPMITAWMARKSHIVAYPVRNADTVNIVAIVNGTAHLAKWDQKLDGALPVDIEQTLAHITATHPEDIEFTRWPLFAVKPGGKWHSKRICLIGDAAHGMEPFAAQGAAMAVEDAFELAWYLNKSSSEKYGEAFANFYMRRAKRVAKAAKRTELNRIAYHQSGLGRWGRNFLFAAQPSDKFMQSLNWLYGYKAKGL